MPEEEKKKRIRPVVEEVPTQNAAHIEAGEEQVEEHKIEDKQELQKKVDEVVGSKKRGVSFRLLFFLTILTALVVGFVSGGVYVYWTGIRAVSEPKATVEPLQTPEPTLVPEVTPEPVVDISKFKVSVLNGSGKIGEAGKVEKILVDGGFDVSNTGNAKTFDYEKTLIEARASVSESVLTKLSDVLSTSYAVEISDKKLPETSNFDIVITVGSKGR